MIDNIELIPNGLVKARERLHRILQRKCVRKNLSEPGQNMFHIKSNVSPSTLEQAGKITDRSPHPILPGRHVRQPFGAQLGPALIKEFPVKVFGTRVPTNIR